MVWRKNPRDFYKPVRTLRSANISEFSARKCPENSNGFTDDWKRCFSNVANVSRAAPWHVTRPDSMRVRAYHCHSVGAWLGSKSRGIEHNKAKAGTSLPKICPKITLGVSPHLTGNTLNKWSACSEATRVLQHGSSISKSHVKCGNKGIKRWIIRSPKNQKMKAQTTSINKYVTWLHRRCGPVIPRLPLHQLRRIWRIEGILVHCGVSKTRGKRRKNERDLNSDEGSIWLKPALEPICFCRAANLAEWLHTCLKAKTWHG